MINQGAGNADSLLLTARELVWQMLCAVRKSHLPECFHRLFFIRHRVVVLCHHNIFQCGQVVHKVKLLKHKAYFVAPYLGQFLLAPLGDVRAIQYDLAERRFIHAAYTIYHGRLAAAGRTPDGNPLALFDCQIDLIEGLQLPVDLGDISQAQNIHLLFSY